MNATVHYPTQELDALATMMGRPGFPVNWRLEIAGKVKEGKRTHHRRWLVRPVADIVTGACADWVVLEIEQGLREFNRKGWELNDPLVIGLHDHEDPFIVDLSIAGRPGANWKPDDTPALLRWMREHEFEELALLREEGRSLTSHIDLWYRAEMRKSHVYATWKEDIAPEPGVTQFTKEEHPTALSWVNTWLVSAEPLTPDYNVRWAWSPVHT
jgi:hypothetical protein